VANLLHQTPEDEEDEEQLSVECRDESEELVFKDTGPLAKLIMTRHLKDTADDDCDADCAADVDDGGG
jgi:hypothetical protein